MPVITLSRQVGSGGLEVARQLCNDLDLAAFDKHMMLRVASKVGIPPEQIIDYSEEEYERRGFFAELFRRSRSVAEFSLWIGSPAIGYERRPWLFDELDAIGMVRATMQAAYERDNVLIIGRGGQAILEHKPDVLHVRVVAPFEARVERVQAEQELYPAQARRYLQDMDAKTAEYLSAFHHIDADDPTMYHLIVNTAKLGIEGAVALIKQALEMLPKRPAEPQEGESA